MSLLHSAPSAGRRRAAPLAPAPGPSRASRPLAAALVVALWSAPGTSPVACAAPAARDAGSPSREGPKEAWREGLEETAEVAGEGGGEGGGEPTGAGGGVPELAGGGADEPLPGAEPDLEGEDPELQRQLRRVRRRGRWGSVLDLHALGIMAGVRVGACLLAEGPGGPCDLLATYGAAAARTTVLVANDPGGMHWWAFLPAEAELGRAALEEPCRLAGRAVETGGEGDCMYYALLHALAEGLAPRRQAEARESQLAEAGMLHLRARLAAWLEAHWQTPLADLGGLDTRPMAELFALEAAAADEGPGGATSGR